MLDPFRADLFLTGDPWALPTAIESHAFGVIENRRSTLFSLSLWERVGVRAYGRINPTNILSLNATCQHREQEK